MADDGTSNMPADGLQNMTADGMINMTGESVQNILFAGLLDIPAIYIFSFVKKNHIGIGLRNIQRILA